MNFQRFPHKELNRNNAFRFQNQRRFIVSYIIQGAFRMAKAPLVAFGAGAGFFTALNYKVTGKLIK